MWTSGWSLIGWLQCNVKGNFYQLCLPSTGSGYLDDNQPPMEPGREDSRLGMLLSTWSASSSGAW
jgi:hypothetical protein